MENLASLLRQARENKRLTLKDVETATRIPMSYLRVLEGGEGLMSDHVYLMPFLRTYAKFLGMDTNAVVTQFVSELQRTDSRTPHPPERRVAAEAAPSAPSRLSFWALPFLLFLGMLLVGSFLWQNGFTGFDILQSISLTKTDGSSDQEARPTSASPETLGTDLPPPGAPAEPTAPIAVAPPSTGLAPTTPKVPSDTSRTATAVPAQTEPTTTVVAASSQPASVGDSTGHRLNIQASSPTWVRIVVDNESPKEMILKTGEAREWSAQQGFTLSFGNAGGVTLNLDGQTLPPVGKSGQVVRNIRLPADTSVPSTATTLQ
jgi:cytoskeleton protein RodZ